MLNPIKQNVPVPITVNAAASAVNASNTIVKDNKYRLVFSRLMWKKPMTALSPGLSKPVTKKVPETPLGKILPKKEAGISRPLLHNLLFSYSQVRILMTLSSVAHQIPPRKSSPLTRRSDMNFPFLLKRPSSTRSTKLI